MHREQAVGTDRSWAGYVTTEAGMVSGWHHHGDYESHIYVVSGALRMESGPDGRDVVDAEPGDFVSCRRTPSTAKATPRRGRPQSSSCGPAAVRPCSTSTGRTRSEAVAHTPAEAASYAGWWLPTLRAAARWPPPR